MKRLRQDLETVRLLTDLSRRREARKRDQAEAVQDVFSRFLFSHEPPLRMAFERIMGSVKPSCSRHFAKIPQI